MGFEFGSRDRNACLAALAGWFALVLPLFVAFDEVSPYMDEIFHIPQAQKYCQGDFKYWDPKITTFPGLYLVSAIVKFAFFHAEQSSCTTKFLRGTNVVLGAAIVVTLFFLVKRREPEPFLAALQALNIALFPPLFFFNFMYYTDVGATLWVLLAIALVGRHNTGSSVLSVFCSSLACGIGTMFRQTNAVWSLFVFGICVLEFVEASTLWGPKLTSRSNNLSSFFGQLYWLMRSLVANARILLVERSLLLLLLTPALFFW
jgi:alpha-1,2-glucosyltransferase